MFEWVWALLFLHCSYSHLSHKIIRALRRLWEISVGRVRFLWLSFKWELRSISKGARRIMGRHQDAANNQRCHGEGQLIAACVIVVLHSVDLWDNVASLLFNTATAPRYIYYYQLSWKQCLLHNAWNWARGCSGKQEIHICIFQCLSHSVYLLWHLWALFQISCYCFHIISPYVKTKGKHSRQKDLTMDMQLEKKKLQHMMSKNMWTHFLF